MNRRHHDFADHVLSAFRASLDEATEQHIGEAGFQHLHGLVREALSAELEAAVGRLDDLVQALRNEIDRPQIEL